MTNTLDMKTIVGMIDSMLTGLAIIKISTSGTELIYMNDGGYRMLGYTKEGADKAAARILSLILEEDKPLFFKGVKEVLKDNGAVDITVRTVSSQGNLRYLQFVTNLYEKCEDGAVVLTAIHDVTDRCQVASEIKRQSELLSIDTHAQNEKLFEYNAKNDTMTISEVNGDGIHQIQYVEQYLETNDAEKDSLPGGRLLYDMVVDSLKFPKSLQQTGTVSIDRSEVSDRYRIILTSISGVEGYVTHAVGRFIKEATAEDSSEKNAEPKTVEEIIRHMGWSDDEEGAKCVSAILEKEPEKIHALYVIDMDSLKLINDMLGTNSGDEALLVASQNLINIFKRMDVTIWSGADDFIVMARNVQSIAVVEHIAQQICSALNFPVEKDGKIMFVTASVGASVYPYHGNGYFELLEKALSGLYETQAKCSNGYQIFEGAQTLKSELAKKNEMDSSIKWDPKNMTAGELENVISDIFSNGVANKTPVETALQLISEHYGFDRAYISVTDEITLEEKEIQYIKDNLDENMAISKTPLFVSLLNRLKLQRSMFLVQNYDMLSDEMAEYFNVDNIKTQIVCPMAIHGKMAGILLLQAVAGDNIDIEAGDMDNIRRFVRLIQMYLLQFGKQGSWHDTLSKLKLLDDFDSYVYLVDYNTKEICFANRRLMNEVPTLSIGDFSYRALHHKQSEMSEDELSMLDPNMPHDSMTGEFFFEALRKWLKVQVSWFNNDNESKVLLVNGFDISEYFG